MSILLSIENISYKVKANKLFEFKSSEKEILKNISFSLEKGNILGIAGESGSGKTTLAKIIAGVLPCSSGKIIFNKSGEWDKLKTSPVQILFQNNGEVLNPYREIEKIVVEAITIRNNSKKNSQSEIEEIFSSVNFPHELWNRKGHQLSGGQQQRAALARLLAVKPELLILDEPFSAQDPESQLNLLNLFKNINKDSGITMICIAHNLPVLKKLCDEIIIMYKGEIVEKGLTEKIFSSPQNPYTKFLLKAGSYNLSSGEIKSFSEG